MKKVYWLLLFIFLSPDLMADGIKLTEGRWAGQVTFPGEDTQPAQIIVGKAKENDPSPYTITMYIDEAPFEFIDPEIRKSRLVFELDTGAEATNICTMELQKSGILSGKCKIEGDKSGENDIVLKMQPPDEAEATESEKTETN